jgi:hypothetical protein
LKSRTEKGGEFKEFRTKPEKCDCLGWSQRKLREDKVEKIGVMKNSVHEGEFLSCPDVKGIHRLFFKGDKWKA